ncbi:MAG: arsenite efflux transporter metallochaperone ArsD [bacterium]
MVKTIYIYDPPMCCSSGVCGPNPDPILISFQDTITKLKAEGIIIERYVITQAPEKFKENPQVMAIIQKEQLSVLPITFCNNEVVLKGKYPTYDECKKFITETKNAD